MSAEKDTPCGYMSARYAQSYSVFGDIVTLPHSGLHLVKRPIAGGRFDLMGLYPYVMSRDWEKLSDDLAVMQDSGAVSVTFVADPFETDRIKAALGGWALCRHFKTHYIFDLKSDWKAARSRTVRKLTRRGVEAHQMRVVPADRALAPDLWRLYQTTAERHLLRGFATLSEQSLKAQLQAPGAMLVTAEDEAGLAGAMISYLHGDTASAHLEFLATRGHLQNTSYALLQTSLEEMERRGVTYVNIGGSAGLTDDLESGLAQFKQRWTQTHRSALLCGEILDRRAYDALSAEAGTAGSAFFPSYRAPSPS